MRLPKDQLHEIELPILEQVRPLEKTTELPNWAAVTPLLQDIVVPIIWHVSANAADGTLAAKATRIKTFTRFFIV